MYKPDFSKKSGLFSLMKQSDYLQSKILLDKFDKFYILTMSLIIVTLNFAAKQFFGKYHKIYSIEQEIML